MTLQRQRRTQTPEYWLEEFEVHKEDLDYLYERLLEDGLPLSMEQLAMQVVRRRCDREAQALSKGSDRGVFYQPQDSFEVGDLVVFPVLDYASGQVVGVREGNNSRYGPFKVIEVKLEEESETREFAAELTIEDLVHQMQLPIDDAEDALSVEQVYEQFGAQVGPQLEERLSESADWVRSDGLWFLRGMLPEVTPFHLNIAEALIDVQGKPLSVQQLLEEVDIAGVSDESIRQFALNWALTQDSRFVLTGTAEQPTWYLQNLIPQGAEERPRRLVPMYKSRGDEWLNRELRDLAFEVGDEIDPMEWSGSKAAADLDRVQMFIPYPHRREGTLPLNQRALTLLTERPSDRFMVTFVDRQTKEKMQGWMVPADGYALGLGEWYEKRGVPVGGIVELARGEDPFHFVLEYDEGKRRGEWVLEVKAADEHLDFGLQRKALAGRYDKHLLIDVGPILSLDDLWTDPGTETQSLFEYLTSLFPELAKLSGQGLVQAKTLYSAVNLTRRCGCVPVFAELTRRMCFDPVGDGNWVYDDSLGDGVYGTAEEMSRRSRSKRHDLIVDRVYRLNMEGDEG